MESPVEGPSEPINSEMIKKAINKMAPGKAAGPSGTVDEMLKPLGEVGVDEVCELVENIISEGCITQDGKRVTSSVCTRVKETHSTGATTEA